MNFSQLYPTPTGISAQTSDEILAKLTDPAVGVIGVYGFAGVGKTTLMTHIKNMLARSSFSKIIIWVKMFRELNLAEVQNDIIFQLKMDKCDGVECLAVRLLERLMFTNFVIVFDDIRDTFSLQEVGIPQPNSTNGSKIVLISRSSDVCRRMGAKKMVRVEVLCPEEAWDLFASKAGKVALFNPDIKPFALGVAQRCCRIPIAITSVGLAMRDEDSVEAWRKSFAELNTFVTKRDDIVLDLLRFSYSHLRNEESQNCFLYCACFPEDYLFQGNELIRYWIAEGFISVSGDINMAIGKGFKILTTLLNKNMLEMFTEGGQDWFKMHELFREMAIKVMKEEPRQWVTTNLHRSFNWQLANTRKLSLMGSKIENLAILPTNCMQVSSLLLHQNPISQIHPLFFTPMLGLKFLDISYSFIIELPLSLSDLVQLRALFLHYCTSLKKIPSVEKMKNLEFLSVCGTSIAELPHGIEGLVSLKFLDLSETTNLQNIEVGVISSLTGLEELRVQRSGLCKMNSPMFAEIRCLKHLAILTISSAGNKKLLMQTISHLKQQNLKIYDVLWYAEA